MGYISYGGAAAPLVAFTWIGSPVQLPLLLIVDVSYQADDCGVSLVTAPVHNPEYPESHWFPYPSYPNVSYHEVPGPVSDAPVSRLAPS
jgi:hypothetical protein